MSRPTASPSRAARHQVLWRCLLVVTALALSASTCRGDAKHGAAGGGDVALALRGDGFGSFSFGDSVESVIQPLQDRWGPPTSDSDFKCESWATSRNITWDGVLLVFDGAGMRGYLFGPRPSSSITPLGKDLHGAATPQGLQLGASIADARRIYGRDFVVDENTLGFEWGIDDDYPGLRGFASGLRDSDTITDIGAGDICAVR